MLPEVQKTHYDYSHNSNSPCCGDVERVVKKDEKGNEIVEFVGVNYPMLQKTRPTVEYFDLESMLKAGLDPRTPIRTGLNSRLEGAEVVEGMASEILTAFPGESKTE